MSDRVSIDVVGGVADVRLSRPEKMNALDDAMFEGLVDAVARIDADPEVRVVVLHGEGRAFCAGLDMQNFARMAQGGPSRGLGERPFGIANRAQQAVWGWRRLRVPVVAAVHGVALGGGFQLMLGADIRVAAPDARLSILEVKWGLIPDMSGTAIMRHLAREDVIRELTFTGRIFSGAEALTYGFVTRVAENPLAVAMDIAREIAGQSPDAVQAAKRLFNELPERSEGEALLAETAEQMTLIGSPNQVEAAKAGLEKRPPKFVSPSVKA